MVIQTKNYGTAEIIGNGSKHNYLKVKFLSTGNIDEFRKDAVDKGEIRDKYAKTLCGIGIIGNIKTRGKFKKYYQLWRNMITRCYNGKNIAYTGKTEVCDRWKTFEFFYNDIHNLDGWDEVLFQNGEIELDKDVKQRFAKYKIYSADTCIWLPVNINCRIQDGQQKLFFARSPDGSVFKSSNITEFAREHSLERRQISAVLHNRYVSTRGWKFSYDEEIV